MLSHYEMKLPPPPMPVGNYTAAVEAGKLLYISGQLPIDSGALAYAGKLGKDLTIEQGQKASELCALNLLSQLSCYLRDRKIKQVIKVEGYINSSDSFTEHAKVLDGASDLLSKLLRSKAGHIRTVVGCSSLPLNAAVEISLIAELE